MTTFNLESVKYTFMDAIRDYTYPQQTLAPSSISLNTVGVIVQPLNIFSQSISGYGVYVSEKIGIPGQLTLTLKNGDATVNTSAINATVGWNVIPYANADLISSRASSLVISGSVNAGNDYLIGKDAVDKYFFNGTLNTFAVAFTIGVNNFVYKVYPESEIDAGRLPVIVVDIVGRPKIQDKYLTGDYAWYYVNVQAQIYSKLTQETDKLAYAMDRGIFRDRRNFADSYYVTPGVLSEITPVRPEVYNRNITWTIRQLISRE
jgi:hypothetical protein